MSRKRTTAESNNDEQTNEDSDPILQNGSNAKRAKLTLSSDTTLQDLPIEMLERILVQAVATEVKDMKMAKSVWKDKAASVISRLTAVCSLWSSILTTDYFGNEVNRILDGTGGKRVVLELRDTAPIRFTVCDVAILKDEILIFGRDKEEKDRFVNVYDRSNLTEAKAVIALTDIDAFRTAACNVSNCVYVLAAKPESLSVMRLTKDGHQFNISPWISDLRRAYSSMTVSNRGNLILALQKYHEPAEISVYDSSGSLLHKIVLSVDVYGPSYVGNVMQKSNGNLVVKSLILSVGHDVLEIDTTGRIVYRYRSSIPLEFIDAIFVDAYDRTFVCFQNRIAVLDPDFNQLGLAEPHPYQARQRGYDDKWHYNSEGHEVLRVLADENFQNGVLSIFHISEK